MPENGSVHAAQLSQMRPPSCAPFDAQQAPCADLSISEHVQETPAAHGLALAMVLEAMAHKARLLKGLVIDRPTQVWCADITYIPMRRGFLYWSRPRIGTAARFRAGGCQTAWRLTSVSRF